QLDTPALLVDLNIMENNLKDTAQFAKRVGIVLRPMVKNHRCPAIAHMQLSFDSTPGVNTPKLGEAEVLASTGVRDIFISNEIVGDLKIERLVNLAKWNKISTSVDNLEVARALNAASLAHNTRLDVLLHVDTGCRRSGTLPGSPTIALALEVNKL